MILNIDDFIAGWCGGVCGLIIGHPFETIKVRQQAFASKFTVAASRTFRHEGIRGFFKGMFLPLITVGPSNALLFGVYGYVMKLQQGQKVFDHKISYNDHEAIKHILIAGTAGGLFQTLFVCPTEYVKTTLQAKTDGKGSWQKHYEVPYKNSFEALKGILRDKGLTGLYRGLTPMLIRDVPTSGLYILTYEMLMYYNFSQWSTPTFIKQIIAGGTAGVLSWIFVFPLDAVKNRMQVDNPYHPKYKNMIDCFIKSYKQEGLGIFFQGVPATLLRTFPVNSAIFIGYETALSILRPS